MYLDNWMTPALSQQQATNNLSFTTQTTKIMGFLVNEAKSELTPTQELTWLGNKCFLETAQIQLSEDNINRLRKKLFTAIQAKNITRQTWKSLLSSPIFAANVLPLSRIQHRWLTGLWNRSFPLANRDILLQMLYRIKKKMLPWGIRLYLASLTDWNRPPLSLVVLSDVTQLGVGVTIPQWRSMPKDTGCLTDESGTLTTRY